MGSTAEKTPFGSPPPYEAGNNGIPTYAAAEDEADETIRSAPRQGALSKVLALLLATDLCGLSTGKATATGDRLDARKRFIDNGSQSLTAHFDLYDLLSIRSWSGSLNIGINPQPADKEHPVPAEVMIESHSGSVNVDMATFNAPERDYAVSINSYSGSIGGHLIHGRKTTVVTRSASISLRFTLSGASNHSSSLSTTSQSGQSDITVLSPISFAGGSQSVEQQPTTHSTSPSIKQMSSFHSTASGSLVLRYPSDWEGTIEGHTQSGALQLHGRDIEVIQRGPHYVVAKKGTGDSKLSFHTASGSANVYFD
ncbi:hypothetical protein LTR85_004437 [Meristemomyces frigidus]|nr:hypothetical protein LTR85_004437 [Meristemomyces frigidus]